MSDSDTSDSDSGIRFKTASTRFKSDGADKYGSSARSSRSLDTGSSSNSRRRSRSRDRDRRRTSDRRSKSRSRSRSRDRRRRRDDRRHRSRTRSPSKRSSHDRRDYRSKSSSKASSHSNSTKETFSSVEPSKVEPTKVLDISVSSLSSQDDHLGKDDAPDDQFGPALPPSMLNKAPEPEPSVEEEKTEIIGPALPPHLIARKLQDESHSPEHNQPSIGPALPPAGFTPAKNATGDSSESELSPFSEEEDEPDAAENDDDLIGPMPGTSTSKAQLELEKRALEMKLRRFDDDDSKPSNATAREDWMLELPDIRKVADMGLGARQFRTREKLEIGDRSVWTDTPSDRERKKTSGGHSSRDAKRDHEREIEQARIAERDKQQEEQVKRHKKKHKRDKSLLDIHQKKLKKEKKDKEEPTRRPFDRNVDLHANRFDDAQKKAIMKKAQLLDTRFSSGGSKYL